jgi:hypothetical protein
MTAFTRTLRKLDADTGRWGVCGVLAAAALAGAFGLWCTLTQVTLYEVAATARIEAGQAAYPVASSVAGRVTQSRLTIGREVSQGEILVELDSTAERLQIHGHRHILIGIETSHQADSLFRICWPISSACESTYPHAFARSSARSDG